MTNRFQQLRLIEALLFASTEPVSPEQILRHLPEEANLDGLMEELAGLYGNRGINLVRVGKRWAFRTSADLAPLMQIETKMTRKPSRATVETLAIVAYHQPVTRGEIEEIRGVALSRGTLDTLLEAGWVKPKGRRRTPGRPVTWGTTDSFLDYFGLESLDSLPGIAELKAAGLLDSRPAITALSTRGRLLDPGEEAEDTIDEEALDGEPLLASDFGEELVPQDPEEDPEAETLSEPDERPVERDDDDEDGQNAPVAELVTADEQSPDEPNGGAGHTRAARGIDEGSH